MRHPRPAAPGGQACPMCGHRAAFAGEECRGCLLKAHCDGDLCPRCGYERVRRGFLASLLRRIAPSLHRQPLQKTG